MSLEQSLRDRAGNACEVCGATEALKQLDVGPGSDGTADMAVLVCTTCAEQISGMANLDPNHLRCLNEAAWSQVPPVQVTAYRLLSRMPEESWARDLLDMLYLDDETLAWAKAGQEGGTGDDTGVVHKDTHGAVLSAGDTVTLIKDLKVKGAGFTAKRGTAVRNISLVADNAEQIEGRVNDQRIVILTEFVKKA
ncbi:PhnA domain-containing protein [Roseibium sediminicola]|uniref:PhnA domain-containing protein n=1 Tax=Roseibium sediminicola TaxID=2933272 RepID=A0ABT0GXG8_9HYPH|nr:alkylphosphonate utilization protein [Roseibium sp. CAU 1639]MCK7614129.1 PhnA domain-containing protein [Roseibium sp. CAU 1639]